MSVVDLTVVGTSLDPTQHAQPPTLAAFCLSQGHATE